jgi:hypothetical protein
MTKEKESWHQTVERPNGLHKKVGLQYHINQMGMVQWDVAMLCGIDNNRFSSWMNGRRLLRAHEVKKVADCLGIDDFRLQAMNKLDRVRKPQKR